MAKNYFSFKMPNWAKFNNAEAVGFLTNWQSLVKATGVDALKCSEAVMAEYDEKVALLTDLVATAKASIYTEKIASADDKINQLVMYLFSAVKAQLKSPISSIKESAKVVQLAITPYKDAHKKSYQEQNQLVRGLLLDLAKFPSDVVALALDSVVESLTLALAQMEVLLNTRNQEQIDGDLGKVKDVRDEAFTLLNGIMTTVLCHHTLTPSEATEAFFASANKMVENAENALAHRLATTKKEEDEEETETEEPTE